MQTHLVTAPPADSERAGVAHPPLQCQTFSSFNSLDSLDSQWDRFALRIGAPVYMTLDWCKTWWSFYGGTAALRIFVFKVDDRIVGIVPMYVAEVGGGPFRLRIARLVGSNIPPKVFDPPIEPEHASQISAIIWNELICREHCDVVSLGPVSSTWLPLNCFRQRESSASEPNYRILDTQPDVHTVWKLPATFPEYLDSLSKNERKNRRKYELRLLAKEFATSLDVLSEPTRLDAEFDHFVAQHALQWKEERKPGHFGSWPRAVDYNRALVRSQGALGRMRFIRILANQETISNQYCFAFGDRLTWELPSRLIGSEWERFSLGRTGVVTMIQAGIEEGKKQIDGGIGHYDYKLRLNAEEHSVHVLRAIALNSKSKLKLSTSGNLLRAVQWTAERVYYRRVMSRLPARCWHQRPLSLARLSY